MRRILTIDGGGIKGVFAASFLAEVEQRVGRSIADFFDLIAGTSTGGLIALSLGLGHDARTTVRKYEDSSPRIFRDLGWLGQIRRIVTSKYSAEPLRRELCEHFGDMRIGDSHTRLLVPTMDVASNRVHIYKTSHHSSLFQDTAVSAVDAALAAVAAPTYFPVHRTREGAGMVDGGIWAHNPTLLAVIEAIGLLKWPVDDLAILSIGLPPEDLAWCTRGSPHVGSYEASLTLASLFTNAQQVSALVNARLLVGADRVLRVEPTGQLDAVPLDGIRAIPQFKYLGASAADRHFSSLRPLFFEGLAEPFVPVHRRGDRPSEPLQVPATGL